jgi:dTDP-glucose 4,6-dehydratase
MKKILVAGGSGFIGTNFVNFLSKKKVKILNIDKLSRISTPEKFKKLKNKNNYLFLKNDLKNLNQLVKIFGNFKPDVVVNFAAESHVDRSITDPLKFIKNNIISSSNLFYAYSKFPINKKIKFFHISTDEVYGSILEGSWDENEPLLPNSPYSASKASADLLVRAYFVTHGLNVNITRCSNNFGPKQDPEKLIPNFIFKLIQNDKVPVYGDGMNSRDWLYVEDHCAGIYLILTKGLPGEIYNIGGGAELTNLDVTQKLLSLAGKGIESVEYVADRLGHDRRYSVTYSKISQLGYSPDKNFEDNLKSTYYWYLNEFTNYGNQNLEGIQ